jgi:flagellum-specific ATP synthase
MNEPITDTVRGILDGHIVLSRDLAHKNHYPAIDILASISRVMNNICEKEHVSAANTMKDLMATYRDAEDLINIGAYKKGSNPKIDKSIDHIEMIESFLKQGIMDKISFEETRKILESVIR